LDPADIFRAAKVIFVFSFGQPTGLSSGLACLPAFWFYAVFLFPDVAWVWYEKITTVPALTLSESSCHRSLPPHVDDRLTRRNDGRKSKENGRTEEERRNDFKLFWEEKGERK
jgi:hypothetical protein